MGGRVPRFLVGASLYGSPQNRLRLLTTLIAVKKKSPKTLKNTPTDVFFFFGGGGQYMDGAFQTKLVGQNGSLAGCSAMLRYKNKNLNAEMSTNVTVLHG